MTGPRGERVFERMRRGQEALIAAFEAEDGGERFVASEWERPGGGGGAARVLEGGRVFERAGVNVSAVHGERVPPSLAQRHPGSEGQSFFATGISLVLHPRNPFAPAFHANFRYFEIGGEGGPWWFGGGADLTPAYPFEEDVRHFHRCLAELCARHSGADYPQFKRNCDDYFTLRHRGEMRGIGGIFFDELSPPGTSDFERDLAFVDDGIDTLLPCYLPLVRRRRDAPYGERERRWQLLRRGRYVEFNLVYDRGTLFGLQTNGNIEAILMSLPPYAHWSFAFTPEPGSPEAQALPYFQPRDWSPVTPSP